MDYLSELEAESVHIIREAAAGFKNPVGLYSIGKDSSVLLRLMEKAFFPGKILFPLLHIDTGFKFKQMIEFRDYYTDKIGVKLIVHQNKEKIAREMKPHQAASDRYIYYKKTKPLLQALKKYGFDAALSGARRDEEKSRAKERVFSHRNKNGRWDPKNQRPEFWHLYNTRLQPGEVMRVFPLSNWTEIDIWKYIKREKIEIVPLYFAKKRKVVKRNGLYYSVDDYVKPKAKEKVLNVSCRYRTLGCSPSTGAVLSRATTVDQIIAEVKMAKISERNSRAIDDSSANSMEDKKREGYF